LRESNYSSGDSLSLIYVGFYLKRAKEIADKNKSFINSRKKEIPF